MIGVRNGGIWLCVVAVMHICFGAFVGAETFIQMLQGDWYSHSVRTGGFYFIGSTFVWFMITGLGWFFWGWQLAQSWKRGDKRLDWVTITGIALNGLAVIIPFPISGGWLLCGLALILFWQRATGHGSHTDGMVSGGVGPAGT